MFQSEPRFAIVPNQLCRITEYRNNRVQGFGNIW